MSKTRVQLVLDALGIEYRSRGVQHWAPCLNPDHQDRNPSWRIRDEPGTPKDGYHICPPCGFSGGLISLIMHVQQIPFGEAKALLEKIEAGVAVIPRSAPESVTVVPRAKGFRLPAGVTVAPVGMWPQMAATYALNTFKDKPKGRSLTPEQIYRWGIGYADEGQLSGRVVLITRNEKGVAMNYTARTYVDHPKRYFEPEHWEKADRGVMFGEQHWQSNRSDYRAVVVTEGGFKALAVERAAPDLALAATSGSAIMPGYPIKLSRFKHVIVSTDADDTGDKIADELMFMLRRQRVRTTRMRLRDGTDHDEIEVGELQELLAWALAGEVA